MQDQKRSGGGVSSQIDGFFTSVSLSFALSIAQASWFVSQTSVFSPPMHVILQTEPSAAPQHSQDKGLISRAQPSSLCIVCFHRSLPCRLPYESCTLCSHHSRLISPTKKPHFFTPLCLCAGLSFQSLEYLCPSLNSTPLLVPPPLRLSLMPSQPPLSHTAYVTYDHVVRCIKTVTSTDTFPVYLYEPQTWGPWQFPISPHLAHY